MQRAKKIVRLNFLLLGLLFLSITVIDKPLAVFIDDKLFAIKPFFSKFTLVADNFTVHIFYLLLLCSGLGLVFLFRNRTKKVAFVLLALVFTLLASSFVTNTMKFEFKRARPDLYIKSDFKAADFYSDETKDYSFPSSHTSDNRQRLNRLTCSHLFVGWRVVSLSPWLGLWNS